LKQIGLSKGQAIEVLRYVRKRIPNGSNYLVLPRKGEVVHLTSGEHDVHARLIHRGENRYAIQGDSLKWVYAIMECTQ
jgi:hypothetical protein